jgi:hypothetical protein
MKKSRADLIRRIPAVIRYGMFCLSSFLSKSINNKTYRTTTLPVVFTLGARDGAVVEALRYKPEGRRIDSRWCHWNFSLT